MGVVRRIKSKGPVMINFSNVMDSFMFRFYFSVKQETGSNPGSPLEASSPGSMTVRGKC